MKGIMIQGTASDVGKSIITTAICRLLANEGIKVAPFKSQNMSNNSYVTMDGNEIGRAQGIQAEAAKTEASVWMNPILLKPKSNLHAEVVLLGKALSTLSGRDYRDSFYEQGMATIVTALEHLTEKYEVIVMEGAGSPVELNLKDKELVNMKVAEIADVPVLLVADIDRGGVFASIIGTLELLTAAERNRVKGIIINKFRGDRSLFDDGVRWIEEKTGIPVLGVVPYIEHMIEGEDSLSLDDRFLHHNNGKLNIAVIRLPFISNYSDIEPFLYENDVSIRWIDNVSEFAQPDALIIPGTKSTILDLQFLREKGLDKEIQSYVKAGGTILGICGGYQMMCETLIDDLGVDAGTPNMMVTGLGLIPAETYFEQQKTTVRMEGFSHPQTAMKEIKFAGYEIHLGVTRFAEIEKSSPFILKDDGGVDGYFGENGQIIGTYLHHLFHNDDWRTHWLNQIRVARDMQVQAKVSLSAVKDTRFNELANEVKKHLDWEQVKMIIEQGEAR